MSKLAELVCRLYRDDTIPMQVFGLRLEDEEKDGISRGLWGGSEFESDARLKGIPKGAKVRLTNVVTSFLPQETKSVAGQLRWDRGVRGKRSYHLTERSEVTIIERCEHKWEHWSSVYYDDDGYRDEEYYGPGPLVCHVDSRCMLCGAYDWGECEPSCPMCGEWTRMEIEEAYVPDGYVWTCPECLCSKPLEFGWLGEDS